LIGVAETRHCQIVEFEGFRLMGALWLNLIIVVLDATESSVLRRREKSAAYSAEVTRLVAP
jgi:hypothetical protein